MRGIQIDVSLPLLLELLGLRQGMIRLFEASAKSDECLSLILTGDDDRLPEVAPGSPWPIGTIECTRIEAKIKAYPPEGGGK